MGKRKEWWGVVGSECGRITAPCLFFSSFDRKVNNYEPIHLYVTSFYMQVINVMKSYIIFVFFLHSLTFIRDSCLSSQTPVSRHRLLSLVTDSCLSSQTPDSYVKWCEVHLSVTCCFILSYIVTKILCKKSKWCNSISSLHPVGLIKHVHDYVLEAHNFEIRFFMITWKLLIICIWPFIDLVIQNQKGFLHFNFLYCLTKYNNK